jgi:anti-sigma factor ChrR (cupin superfamily)
MSEADLAAKPSVFNPNVSIRNVPGSIMMDAALVDSIPWAEDPRILGVAFKHLWIDLNSGAAAALMKIAQGALLPVHCHYSPSLIYCTKGRFTYEAGSIGPGGFGFEPCGVVHEPEAIDEDAEILIVSFGNSILQFYNPDGSPAGMFSLRDALLAAWAAHGSRAVDHLGLPDWYWQS